MAVKLYTPDSNVIVHETKVDFRRRVVQRQVNLVQYDKSMPVIAVQLCSNGNEYVLPENASAYIRFGKRDHTYVYNECLGCDQTRTIVYFAITDQMTVFYGEHTPIVELRIGDTVAGSGSIPIWIDRNPIQNGDTESKSDLSVFEKAIEAAQKIDVKLPTDLKATATNLSLLAGSTKIGSGINLSGFEYDEATKTLKASGGGASVSPCLNLINMEDASVRTSITEEEKTNLENGLYNSVLYADLSTNGGEYSMYFPENALYFLGEFGFSTYNISVDEASNAITIPGSSLYSIRIGDKNADGTYPIVIEKQFEAMFGGGGGGGSSTPPTSVSFKDVTVSELSNYSGKFGKYHITDLKINLGKVLGADFILPETFLIGVVDKNSVYGSIWGGSNGKPTLFVNTCKFNFSFDSNNTINAAVASLGGINTFLTNEGTINSKDGFELLQATIDTGEVAYIGEANIDHSGRTTRIVGISSIASTSVGGFEFCTFDCLAKGYGIGRMTLALDNDSIPQFKSFTTWLPPVTSYSEGKALIVTNGNAKWTTTPRYEHTITIKNSEGKILWTQTIRNSSNTVVNSYTNLKTLFGEATYAGFGEYCQLNLEGGTEATDKLIKADGTEVTLASLGAIVYTDKCFLPK